MVTAHDRTYTDHAGQPVHVRPDLTNSIWYGSALLTTLAAAGDTGGRYALIRLRNQRSFSPPPHRHGVEAFYVIRGLLRFDIAGEIVEAAEGSFVEVPAGIWHTFSVESDEAEYLILTVSPWGLERFFAAVGRPAEALELPGGRVGPPDLALLQQAAPQSGIELAPPGASPAELAARRPALQ